MSSASGGLHSPYLLPGSSPDPLPGLHPWIPRWLQCPRPPLLWSPKTSLNYTLEQRARKTKIGTEVAHGTRDSGTTFKVRRSKVKVAGAEAYCGGTCLLYLLEVFNEQTNEDDEDWLVSSITYYWQLYAWTFLCFAKVMCCLCVFVRTTDKWSTNFSEGWAVYLSHNWFADYHRDLEDTGSFWCQSRATFKRFIDIIDFSKFCLVQTVGRCHSQ